MWDGFGVGLSLAGLVAFALLLVYSVGVSVGDGAPEAVKAGWFEHGGQVYRVMPAEVHAKP